MEWIDRTLNEIHEILRKDKTKTSKLGSEILKDSNYLSIET